MDIGFIIFLIIASVIGNMLKENKKQQQRNKSRLNTDYVKPKEDMGHSYKPPARAIESKSSQKGRRYAAHIPSGKAIMDTFEQVGKVLLDESFSLEGQRKNIGDTYENREVKPHSFESKPAVSEDIEDNKVASISYKRVSFEDEDNSAYEEGAQTGNYRSLDLNFKREDFIRGIILAEVLGPPKCRKR